MKDVELLAESVARDAATACAARVMRRAVESGGVNSLPRASVAPRLGEMEKQHALRALTAVATNRRDLELLMSMPPLNPS